MGRRKKEQKENKLDDKNQSAEDGKKAGTGRFVFSVSRDVKRNVVGVVLFTLAAIITLGFLGYAGVIGEFLNRLCGQAIGWMKLLFPLFLIMAGIVLLFKKETIFYVSKIIGLILVFISTTGLFHYFISAERELAAADAGQGGGYLGYYISFYFSKYLGNVGGAVLLLAIFLLGIIIAFEFSLLDFSGRLKDLGLKKTDEESVGDLDNNDSVDLSLDPIVEMTKDDHGKEVRHAELDNEEVDGNSNIGNIKFIDDDDETYSGPDDKNSSDETGESVASASSSFFKKQPVQKSKPKKWVFPPLSILERSVDKAEGGNTDEGAEVIVAALRNFGIEVEKGEVKVGPSVTQYTFRPAIGVKIAEIKALQDDLSLALASTIRIEAPIPGKSLVGIEVPNIKSASVCLRDALESKEFKKRKNNLSIVLGKNVSGEFVIASLDKMPHLMIAGTTGTGKSVCINSIIASLLYQNSPEDLKFILIDPKRVELALYNKIDNLATPVVVDNYKVVNVLKWAVKEMEDRYKLFEKVGARDIGSYLEKVAAGEMKKEIDPDTGTVEHEPIEKIPYIVIIIDELSDLMSSHKKEVEGAIVRIAQMARAVGIHLIVSTQRPSVQVLTGLIKANISTRIAFKVTSQIDSRTILDRSGAEKLLGRGDMLYACDASKPQRIQGVFVSENEVKELVSFIINNNDRRRKDDIDLPDMTKATVDITKDPGELDFSLDEQNDDLYNEVKKEILLSKRASASFIQRRFRVGYTRAARLLDLLESNGVIGPVNGAKPREIYGSAYESDANHTDSSGQSGEAETYSEE